jgi:hypothetical protein
VPVPEPVVPLVPVVDVPVPVPVVPLVPVVDVPVLVPVVPVVPVVEVPVLERLVLVVPAPDVPVPELLVPLADDPPPLAPPPLDPPDCASTIIALDASQRAAASESRECNRAIAASLKLLFLQGQLPAASGSSGRFAH